MVPPIMRPRAGVFTTWRVAWLAALFTGVGVAHAGEVQPTMCPPRPVDSLVDVMDRLHVAFEAADDEAFDGEAVRVAPLLACIHEPLLPSEAQRLHLTQALLSFVGEDVLSTKRSLTAVRAIDPAFRPSEDLFPTGHPLRRMFDRARPSSAVVSWAARPSGALVLDGRALSKDGPVAVPKHRAFVLQMAEPTTDRLMTVYHQSAAELPIAEWQGEAAGQARLQRRKTIRTVGTVVGATLITAAAGVGGRALWSRSQLDELPQDELATAISRVNTMGAVAGTLAGVGVASTTVTWVVRW